jgi:hypothetical protein
MLRGATARVELGFEGWAEQLPLLNGVFELVNARRMLSAWSREASNDDPLHHHEERQFSQNGEDGIIRWLLDQIGVTNGWFVEIGAADGEENCTRSLVETGWTGLWVEADGERARHARKVASERVCVIEEAAEPSTIPDLLAQAGVPDHPDVVIVDIDSNDWWLLGALLSAVSPRLLVAEYNAAYKPGRWWVEPYRSGASWDKTFRHGASLDALAALAGEFDLSLVGCNSTGVNSFFLANADLRRTSLRARRPRDVYRGPWFAPGLWGHPRRRNTNQAETADAVTLTSEELSRVSLRAATRVNPRFLPTRRGGLVFVEAIVSNGTDKQLTSSGAAAFNLASRWRDKDAPRSTWFDEPRHPLPVIPPRDQQPVRIWLPAPSTSGIHRLELALVQEDVGWPDDGSVELDFELVG